MAQMAFAEHHDMIEAFPADRADQPFCVGVLPGGTRRRRAVSNADRSNAADKYLSVCTVAIPDQVARDLLPAASRSILICCLSTRISASSATRDRNWSPAIPKINRHK